MLQADYGAAAGYNVDHHISGYEPTIHRYTMESSEGGALNLSLTVEVLLTDKLSFGLQAGYMETNTTGSHRWVQNGGPTPVGETWNNGVSVSSSQSTIAVFFASPESKD